MGSPPPSWPPPGAPPMNPPPAPGYPPGAYPPPGNVPYPLPVGPPARTSAKTVFIIVAVVVVVVLVITAALAALLYLMVSGLGGPPFSPPVPPHVTLVAGSWNDGNLTIHVLAVTPADSIIPIDREFVLLVYSANNTLYYNGPPGQVFAVNGTSVSVSYDDVRGPGIVSPDDAIRISVQPAASLAVRGGSFDMVSHEAILGDAQPLPP